MYILPDVKNKLSTDILFVSEFRLGMQFTGHVYLSTGLAPPQIGLQQATYCTPSGHVVMSAILLQYLAKICPVRGLPCAACCDSILNQKYLDGSDSKFKRLPISNDVIAVIASLQSCDIGPC